MKIINKLLTGALLTGATFAHGQFVELDTFETDDLSAWTVVTSLTGEEIDAGIEVVDDPTSAGNGVLSVYGGAVQETTSNMRVWREFPAAPETGYTTIYLRFMQPLIERGDGSFVKAQVDTVWGVTQAEVPSGYPDYATPIRIEYRETFDIFDGDVVDGTVRGYQTMQPRMTADTWYECWIVLDNDFLRYQLYVKGGTEYPQQTLAYPPSSDADGFVSWRNTSIATALNKFYLATSAGTQAIPKGLDPMYFDDIYVDQNAKNLESPAGGSGCTAAPGVFADYCVDGNGWVDTGDFMGYVYTAHYPWVYSYDLSKYVYIGGGEGSGAWAFVIK